MSNILSTIDLVKSDKIIRLEVQLKECKAENARLKRELAKLRKEQGK